MTREAEIKAEKNMECKAHSRCEYVAVLLLWDHCRGKGSQWTYMFLKNMAKKARAALGPGRGE